MADPRVAVLIGMLAFYYTVGVVVYNGRRVATASLSDRALHLEHHIDSLWWLLRATILLLVLVLMVVNSSKAHEYSALFWVHESMDVTFVALASLAILFNGKKSVNHRYLGWSMAALTIPIGITGLMLLSHLQF